MTTTVLTLPQSREFAPAFISVSRLPISERREKAFGGKSRDQDRGKGATEQDSQNQGGNTSMQGQLGHREEDAELKNADSDLPGKLCR